MIQITTQGRVKQKKRLEEFACDVINDLLPREFKRDIEIHVRFTKLDDAMGFCTMNDEDEIAIEVDNRHSLDNIASTLAHELVHAKQYIRRELNPTMTRWKKQIVPYGPRGGCKIPYARQPWEREAFKKEEVLKELYW